MDGRSGGDAVLIALPGGGGLNRVGLEGPQAVRAPWAPLNQDIHSESERLNMLVT